MVCMDGFILTHAMEEVDVPTREQVQAWLPPYVPRQSLDVDDPVSIGAMVGPEAFTEVKYLAHHKQMEALELIPEVAASFKESFGRDSGGLVRPYKCEDAETIIVALGSVLGTIKDVIDERRERGEKIGALGITSFRPFPLEAVREVLQHAQRFVAVEKAFSVGLGGIVAAHCRAALSPHPIENYEVAAGLGGRPITKASLHGMIDDAVAGTLEHFSFLDLDRDLIEKELERERANRRSGPIAENIIRDVGIGRATAH